MVPITPSAEPRQADEKRAERSLLFKLDAVMIPFAIMIYLGAYLDRGNLGNARLLGLEKDVLDGSDTNYSVALACFYITYIVFSTPGTILAKHFNPSHSIAFGTMLWAVSASCQAATTNRAGVFVSRLFLGIGEAFTATAIIFYLSIWYTKLELANRFSLFVAGGTISGAFSGLISFGIAHIKSPSISPWRILFLIEGLPGVLLAFAIFFFMPSRPELSKYLTEEERGLCIQRIQKHSVVESSLGLHKAGVKRGLTDWKTFTLAVVYACVNLGLGSVTGFLPTIVEELGYSQAKAQLFTVPPYAVALVLMLILATWSDYKQTRGIFVAGVFVVQVIGWVLLFSLPAVHPTHATLHARYFGCICVVSACYCNIPLLLSWQADNSGIESQRATSLGMMTTVGQCLALVSAFIFPTSQGPQYRNGTITNIAFACLGFVLASFISCWFRWENRRRDRSPSLVSNTTHTGQDILEHFDRSRNFRYTP